jgi:hypothetical protein
MITPNSRTLRLLADVKACWWSTYAMVERCLKLHPALEKLFRDDVMSRVSPNQPTNLESLALSPMISQC